MILRPGTKHRSPMNMKMNVQEGIHLKMNLEAPEGERRIPIPQDEQRLEKTQGEEIEKEAAALEPLQDAWDRQHEKDWKKLSRYERIEAEQDVVGKNLLAAAAPQSLSNLGIEALDKEMRLRQQERHSPQNPDPLLLSTVASSHMFQVRSFRLMFARADRFESEKAASRIASYYSYALELFGQPALLRPICPSDFEPADDEAIKSGWIQLLLTRDKIGRRIVVLNDLGPGHMPIRNKMRVALFLLQAAAADIESQCMGVQLVIQVFNLDESQFLTNSSTREQFRRLFACSPVRFSCIHFCVPAMPSSAKKDLNGVDAAEAQPVDCNAIMKTTASLFGTDERVRTKFHTGSIIECHGKLAEYGINPDSIPMTSTGRVKLRDHEKWVMIQVGRERSQQQRQRFSIVECPTNKHILLVKGRHVARHEGNVRLRNLLRERYDERNEASRSQKIAITAQVLDTLTEEGYVFLTKNSGDFWVVPERRTVLEKLAIAFRTIPRLKPMGS